METRERERERERERRRDFMEKRTKKKETDKRE